MKITGIFVTIFFVCIIVSILQSEPGFNGTTPGCAGSGCHTLVSGNVTATILTNNQVQITVSGATGNVGGELVNSNGQVVAVINSTTSNPFILTAPAGGTYTINAGYKSPSRRYGTTTVNIVTSPTAPTLLNTNPVSNLQINLSWVDNSSNEDGFKVERKTTASGTYTEIATVGSNVTSYNSTSLSGSTEYCYRVRAYNTVGNSAYTNESCNTTFPDLPAVPLNLVATLIQSPLSVELSWTDNSNNEDGFIIEKESAVEVFTIIDTVTSNVINFTDLNITNLSYNYRIRAYNITGYSEYSNIAQVTVPVELTSFAAVANKNSVDLRWQTATETNNSGFEIERLKYSSNEKMDNWESVAFVTGNGTTTEPKSYFYKDENLSMGKYEYRLKQLDYDGNYNYSNEIEVVVNAPDKFSLNQNYPNPFNPGTTIEYQIPQSSFVTIKVYDVLGKEVVTLVNEEKPAGVHEVNFIAKDLTSGLYLYKIKAESFEQTRKMLLLK